MEIGKRIKQRRKQLKLSVEDVAKKLGKNRATVYRYENNEIENMPYEVMIPLAEVLKVSPAYLMGWDDNDNNSSVVREQTMPYNYVSQPISAGVPLAIDGVTELDTIEISNSVLGKWAGDKDLFVTRVNGESMNRVIPDKSLIAVKPIEIHQFKDGDIVVYSDGGDYSVKRYYLNGDEIVFRPDSYDASFFEQRYQTTENITIHGKVVVYIVELD